MLGAIDHAITPIDRAPESRITARVATSVLTMASTVGGLAAACSERQIRKPSESPERNSSGNQVLIGRQYLHAFLDPWRHPATGRSGSVSAVRRSKYFAPHHLTAFRLCKLMLGRQYTCAVLCDSITELSSLHDTCLLSASCKCADTQKKMDHIPKHTRKSAPQQIRQIAQEQLWLQITPQQLCLQLLHWGLEGQEVARLEKCPDVPCGVVPPYHSYKHYVILMPRCCK